METINTVSLIYDQMDMENEPRQRKLRHYPSSLSAITPNGFIGKCRRATYYSMQNMEVTDRIDPVALFKMDMGNVIHDKVNDVMNRALERMYGDNFKVITINGDLGDGSEEAFVWQCPDLKLPVSGRMDKIFEVNGRRVVCEWKSTYGFGVKYIQDQGAKEDHLLQTVSYLEQDVIPVDDAILMYVARDSGYLYGFYIEKDGDKLKVSHMNSDVVKIYNINWSMAVEALKPLEESLEADGVLISEGNLVSERNLISSNGPIVSDHIPGRDYTGYVNEKLNKLMGKSDWQCKYCNYVGLCYGCEK